MIKQSGIVFKGLILLYLAMGHKFSGHLIKSDILETFETDKKVQHILLFLAIYAILSESLDINSSGTLTTTQLLVYTVICYLGFLILNKINKQWFLYLAIAGFGGYLINSYVHDDETRMKEDKTIPEQTRENRKKWHERIMVGVMIVFAIVALSGVVASYNSSNSQSGGGKGGKGGNMSVVNYLFN